MRSVAFWLSLAIAIGASAASEPPAPPAREPGPEMKKLLSTLSGSWSITYEYVASDGAPRGGGRGKEVYRAGPGGSSIIEEIHSKEAGKELSGLGLAWWDEKAHGFRTVWCDGENPRGCRVNARLANWKGDRFVLGDEWESEGKRISFEEVFSDLKPASFTQTLSQGEMGTQLKPIMRIKATKD